MAERNQGVPDFHLQPIQKGQLMNTTPDTDKTANAGLVIKDVVVGRGAEAKAGDDIVVHYVGKVLDGNQFDSSRQRQDPLDFSLGAGDVIKGLDQGVAGMRVGGRRKLTIPAEMAYGAEDKGDGRPFGDLVFIVDVYAVK